MNYWNRLKILKIFLSVVKDPNRTEEIFKAVEIVTQDPDKTIMNKIEHALSAHPGLIRLYKENYNPTIQAVEDLAVYPVGSFGHGLYLHLKNNNLDINLFPKLKGAEGRLIEYLSARIYQDHDLWHVLLDYNVSLPDELALQAFSAAQVKSPISTMLVAGGILHLLVKDPEMAVAALKKVSEGFRRGENAPFLLAFKLHEMFALPLKEVRGLCLREYDHVCRDESRLTAAIT